MKTRIAKLAALLAAIASLAFAGAAQAAPHDRDNDRGANRGGFSMQFRFGGDRDWGYRNYGVQPYYGGDRDDYRYYAPSYRYDRDDSGRWRGGDHGRFDRDRDNHRGGDRDNFRGHSH